MALVKRKRTIRAAIRDILLAPFAFILAGIVTSLVWLVLAVVLMLFSMWMAREPLTNLLPSMDTVYTIIGVIVFVAIAAIPLALRDYFSNGGFETVWEPTSGCLHAAKRHVDQLIAGNVSGFCSVFSHTLHLELPQTEFDSEFKTLTNELGWPVSIADQEEAEIPEHVFNDPDYDSTIDCIVQVVMNHSNDKQSLIALYLNSAKSFEISNLQFAPIET
jgi:hypothetical protein